jgi:hypothetical protein
MVDVVNAPALQPGAFQSLRDDQVQNTLENQGIQAKNIANQQAASMYGIQALTGAAATGNQDLWNAAKQHVAALGMDTSGLADDVQTGGQQVEAIRQAQYNSNPMVAALGLGIKAQQAAATAAGVNGTMAPTGPINPVTGGPLNLSGAIPGVAAGAAQPPQATPTPQPTATQVTPTSALPQVDASPRNPGMALPATQGTPQAAPATTPAAATPSTVDPDILSAARMRAINQIGPLTPNANPKTQMEWNTQINDLVNKDPAVMAAQAQASSAGSETGKEQALDAEDALKVQNLKDRLAKNLTALSSLNASTPEGPAAGLKAGLSKLAGDLGVTNGTASTGYDQWNQIDSQQVLSEAQTFAAANPGSKISQQLLKIAQQVASIDPNSLRATRQAEINNSLAELNNKAITTQNLSAAHTGQPQQPYQNIPVTAPGQSAYTPGVLKQGTDGTYAFMGGDPTQQASWKKVQ